MAFHQLAKTALGDTPLGAALGYLPFAKSVYRRFALNYRHHNGLFCGVYKSFAEAAADIPPARVQGWDSEETAGIWLHDIAPMRESTYPLLMWLSVLLREKMTLVDYGGSIGLTYYAYRRYFQPPKDIDWTIVEVPAIAAQGRKVAVRESAALQFVSKPEEAPPADILISAGAIQYIDGILPGLLDRFAAKPKHLLLNKVPLTKGQSFWTLQNFSTGVSPYQVYSEEEFLGYFAAEGYVLRDRWKVHELDCVIPFEPDRCVPAFDGLYFEKAEG